MDWLLPLIAGTLVLIGTGIGLYITYNFRSQSKEKQATIEELNKEIDKVGKTNQNLNEQILKLSENLKEISDETKLISQKTKDLAEANKNLSDKNVSLTEKTIELSEIIKNIQTGGNSFCYLAIGNIDNSGGLLTVVSQGDYPLYKLQMRIVDLELFNSYKGNLTLETIGKTQVIIDVGEMPSKTAQSVGRITSDFSKDKKDFNVFFSARNGFFTQTIRMRKVDGVWKTSTKVTKDFSNDVLHEKTDEGYPIEEEEK